MAAGQGSEAELPTPNGRALVVLSSVDRLPDVDEWLQRGGW